MSTFIALLRGINVGGKNKIKMADLKCMCEEIGFTNVETYIQSGNVIFKSNENEEVLAEKIERGLEEKFGIKSSVILRTASELYQLKESCPFSEEELKEAEEKNTEGESFYVGFLTKAPEAEKIELLNAYKSERDNFVIKDRNVYLLLHHSIRNSKLANSLHKLDDTVTVRNWKTVNKLIEISKLNK